MNTLDTLGKNENRTRMNAIETRANLLRCAPELPGRFIS